MSKERDKMVEQANADVGGAFDKGVNPHNYTEDGETPTQTDAEGKEVTAGQVLQEAKAQAITVDDIRKARHILKKYREGKKVLEHNIVQNEKWFKKRHWDLMDDVPRTDPRPSSGWLFNTITSKHADFMDNAPMADVLPREIGDQEEAQRLQSIIPVILDENNWEETYSNETWYKLKHGTGVYGVFWSQDKLNGLGDVDIVSCDILNLFWEAGVTDIQKSPNFFSVELVDNDILEQTYPELRGKLHKASDSTIQKYWHDEKIDTQNKSAVIDWYYKKYINGKQTVQYVKFVDETILYATENDTAVETKPQAVGVYDSMGNPAVKEDGTYDYDIEEVVTKPSMAEIGLYEHGMYPFVFDVLFPEANMPTGFGFVSVCKSAQASIDIMNNALEKNIQFVCNPRYVMRLDGGINEDEFSDPNNLLIHADGNLGSDTFVPVNVPQMVSGNYLSLLDAKIQEMKETAGNRDVSNGGTTSGVTSASGIAALQEASGRMSRDMIKTTYRAYEKVVKMVIELIRQFYDMPRQFRIIGEYGQAEFVSYDNSGLKEQQLGSEFGIDMGTYKPEFDLKVEAEKQNPYTRMSQNDLALQFYNNGIFNPQYADQALMTLNMMEFQGKQQVIQKVQQNGGMYQQMMQMQQQMLQMAQIIDAQNGSNMAEQMAEGVNQQIAVNNNSVGSTTSLVTDGTKESAITAKARAKAAETTAPR